jgi:hypothetical protein
MSSAGEQLINLLVDGVRGGLQPGLMRRNNRKGEANNPRVHQRNCVRRFDALSDKCLVLAHAMGTGKTVTSTLIYAAIAARSHVVPKWIVVCPKAVILHWRRALGDWINVGGPRIFATTSINDVTIAVLERIDILIVSRDFVSNAFCLSHVLWKKHHQVQIRNSHVWVQAWDRKDAFGGASVEVHPIFAPPTNDKLGWRGRWDLCVFDELHYYRNVNTRACASAHFLASASVARVGLSGTAVTRSPADLAGCGRALNAPRTPHDFHQASTFTFGNHRGVRIDAVDAFVQQCFDRVPESAVPLPPLRRRVRSFRVNVPKEFIQAYNNDLETVREVRVQTYSERNVAERSIMKMLVLMGGLQRFTIAPSLHRHGSTMVRNDKALIHSIVNESSGALEALGDELIVLQNEGHRRIVVACNEVVPLWIALYFIAKRFESRFGKIYEYSGEIRDEQRRETIVSDFLESDAAILFLSIKAGGVGLNIVPTCQAMVLWGPMPYAAADVEQVIKRIHRIGQTKAVTVTYVVAYGSVDASILQLHKEKSDLLAYVQDGDATSLFGGDANETIWKKIGRILDSAQLLDEHGQFPIMPPDHVLVPGVRVSKLPNAPSVDDAKRNVRQRITNPDSSEADAAPERLVALSAISL